MKLDKSSYQLFLECKESTNQASLGRETKSNSKEGVLGQDDFILSVIKAIDECIALAPLAKEEVKDKNYLLSAIEASSKRLNTQKSLYEFLNKSSQSEAIIVQNPNSAEFVNEAQAISRLNFALSTIAVHEETQWERASSYSESTSYTDPWTFVVVFVAVIVGLRFLSLRKPSK